MEIAAAAMAGGAARLLSHPLDTIKTLSFTGFAGHAASSKLETKRMNFISAAKMVWDVAGPAGFYRGVGITVVGAVPGVGLYLSSYNWVSSRLQQEVRRRCEQQGWGLHAAVSFISGILAEAFSCLVWVPIDVSKERMQTQPPSLPGRYSGSWNAVKTIIQREGFLSLYKGYLSTLCSFGPFSGVYFVFYEFFTVVVRSLLAGSRDEVRMLVAPLLAGCGATAMACMCTNPLELVKTRLQVQRMILSKSNTDRLFSYSYKGLVHGIGCIVATDGWTALWRGTGSRIAFQAPNAAMTMMLYEYFLSKLKEKRS